MRVVLLIDDPPSPRYAGPRRLLDAALALPAEIEALLSEPRERLERAQARFDDLPAWKEETTLEEVLGVAADYEYASRWLRSLSANYGPTDHSEQFVATYVIGQLAADLAVTGAALRAAANDDPARIPLQRLRQLQQRLTWTFRAEISAFQRKQYASLSAEPNKAIHPSPRHGLRQPEHRGRRNARQVVGSVLPLLPVPGRLSTDPVRSRVGPATAPSPQATPKAPLTAPGRCSTLNGQGAPPTRTAPPNKNTGWRKPKTPEADPLPMAPGH